MIDWAETLKKYVQLIYQTRHKIIVKDFCYWYQNTCRYYER